MKNAWFITGTDTEIGKTFVSCALLHTCRAKGLSAVGMKPVAAGIDALGKNEDVEQLRAASSIQMPYETINPYLFKPAIAPHIAAQEASVSIDLYRIRDEFTQIASVADVVLVEGVGGFRVPLGDQQDSADLARVLGLPVILVVGMRLGCINHALLSADAIRASGLRLTGWVANRACPEMSRFEENVTALKQRLNAPLLGVVPHMDCENAAETASALLNLPSA